MTNGKHATTGVISGTAAAAESDAVTVSASDGALTTSQTFNWFVVNNQTSVVSPGDQTNSEADTVSLPISGKSVSVRKIGVSSYLSEI